MKIFHLDTRSINVTRSSSDSCFKRAVFLLIWLLPGVASLSQAQIYYTINDGDFNARTDQLRQVKLDGTGDVQVITNFINVPGVMALDPINKQAYVADARNTAPNIVKVNLTTTPATSTTLLVSTNTKTILGLAVDNINGYLYYTVNDGVATTTTDELRRIKLDGTGNELIATGFAEIIGDIALDLAHNRIFVIDTRILGGPSQIFGVDLTTKAATEFVNNAKTIRGLAVDVANDYLYYINDDTSPTTATDELRRKKLDGSSPDGLVRTGFVNTPGPLIIDAPNNRLLGIDARNTAPKLSALDLTSLAVSTFPTTAAPAQPITGIGIFGAPTVTTNAAGSVTSNSASLGGTVASPTAVTDRGVVYSSTNSTPQSLTIGAGTQVKIGTGQGSFSQTVSGLSSSTTYYVRAYAINPAGTSYGPVVSFVTPAPNTAPTNITISPSPSTVSENQPINTPVGNFSTTDADAGQTFSYSLVAGAGSDDNASFKLVGNQLQTNAVFDFETKPSYSIRLRTTDSGNPALSFEKSFTITITNINELAVTISAKTDVSCNGGENGTASATASGESAPFTYAWRNTTTNTTLAQTGSAVTGLTAGAYSLTVTATASGFTSTTSFAISQPAALTISVAQTKVSTAGGSDGTASVSVSGGTPGYSYDWTPGNPIGDGTASVTSLSAGAYEVTVTDANGCTASASLTITTASDLTPILYARPSPAYGTATMSVVVSVAEVNSTASTGTITVKIPKDGLIDLTFPASATLVNERTVQNNAWSFSGPSGGFYTLTTTNVIAGGGVLSFGLNGTLTPGGTTGILSISAILVGGSGGEIRIDNNNDADKIEYFPQ